MIVDVDCRDFLLPDQELQSRESELQQWGPLETSMYMNWAPQRLLAPNYIRRGGGRRSSGRCFSLCNFPCWSRALSALRLWPLPREITG